jgi:uncharacterized protein
MNKRKTLITFLLLFIFSACQKIDSGSAWFPESTVKKPPLAEISSAEIRKLLEGLSKQLETTKKYSQDYFVIPYPNGDVPAETGACTDVVVRAFRATGVDLQREVHEDMK